MLKKLLSVIIILLTSVSGAAYSSVIYQYTGNYFDSTSGLPTGYYDESNSIQATMVLGTALAPNLNLAEVEVLSFSITDGNEILTESTSLLDTIWTRQLFSTDGNGDITEWIFRARQDPLIAIENGLSLVMSTISVPSQGIVMDVSTRYLCETDEISPCHHTSILDNGFRNNVSGIWVVNEVSAIPVPASLWLMFSGIIGLVGVARKTNG